MTIDEKFDDLLKVELEKRLKRPAKQNEIVNADTDADLCIEVLWKIISDMEIRLKKLEK